MLALTENMMSLKDATKYIPTRPNISTVWRWSIKGTRGVKLETILVGSQRYTTKEAISRFLASLNGSQVQMAEARAKELAAVNRELDSELT